MKLKNKKTGEIAIVAIDPNHRRFTVVGKNSYLYDSLAELNAEWEDYGEGPYVIDVWEDGCICDANFGIELEGIERAKECGLYFGTKEEAEKAVEKLKAWKRLKEAGFEFGGWSHTPITKSLTGYNLHIKAYSDKLADYMGDLQLLFGGRE